MKRLFTALLAAVFAFAFAAPVTMHNAAAAGKDEVMTSEPASTMDNAMKDGSGKGDNGKADHKMKHHHKHMHHAAGHPHAKTNEAAKTIGDNGDTKKHKHMHKGGEEKPADTTKQ